MRAKIFAISSSYSLRFIYPLSIIGIDFGDGMLRVGRQMMAGERNQCVNWLLSLSCRAVSSTYRLGLFFMLEFKSWMVFRRLAPNATTKPHICEMGLEGQMNQRNMFHECLAIFHFIILSIIVDHLFMQSLRIHQSRKFLSLNNDVFSKCSNSRFDFD